MNFMKRTLICAAILFVMCSGYIFAGGLSGGPRIAVSGSHVYVVWSEEEAIGDYEIYFRRSTDNGATWKTTKHLTANSGWSGDPDIAVSGSNVYVVWTDISSGNDEIMFRRSTDDGVTWQAEVNLSNTSGISLETRIAVSGTYLCVLWNENGEIYFRRSSNSGGSWNTAKNVSNTAENSNFPAVAASGANVYISYSDYSKGNDEIFFKRSLNNGTSWQNFKRLTNTSGASQNSAISVSGANIYVAWQDNTPGNNDIYFKRSLDSGVTWQTSKKIITNSTSSLNPTLAAGASNLTVVWENEATTNSDIFFRTSTDNGVTWQNAKRVANNAGSSVMASSAANGANLYVTWWDNTPGDNKIYFRRSADNGATWAACQILN